MFALRKLFFLAAGLLAACQPPPKTASAPPANTTRIEFSIAGMICGMCEATSTEALKKIPGVYEARAEYPSLKASVLADARVTRETIRAALGSVGFEPRFPGESVASNATPLPEKEVAALDIQTISHGEEIDIAKYFAPGKYTVFDYYADWCGPCHLLSPKLEHLVKDSRNVALRKVDIANWNSAAAKQATKDFGLTGLPFVRAFGPKGEFLGEFEGNRFEKLEAILQGKTEKR